jgi:hypothetical protein
MKKILLFLFLAIITSGLVFGQSIEQQLIVTQNSHTTVANGFRVAVQAKATGLGVANTLKSATIDVSYDNTKLTYVGSTFPGTLVTEGYTSNSVTNNTTFLRVIIAGSNIGTPGDEFADPPTANQYGLDLTTSYVTLVTLRFTIIDVNQTADLAIQTGSNSMSIFSDHSNLNLSSTNLSPAPTLTAPINITGETLPVELTSMTVAAIGANSAKINWSTVTETNNSGFAVERRAEGSNAWSQVAFIAGAGTSSSAKQYSYQDDKVGAGVFYYRLKQIDNTGAFKYSSSVEVNVGVAGKVFQMGNYPNPFNPSTEIQFSVPEDGFATLKVFNMLGQEVATLFSGVAKAGHFVSATFNASRFASGVYLSRLEYNGKSMVQRMLLAK